MTIQNQKSKIQNRPSLAYGINFSTPGTYTLWLRGYPTNARGDSAYVGFTPGNQSITTTGFAPRSWSWAKASTTLPVTQTGVLTLNIWMREDGLRLDRLVLTTDTTYVPGGFGLAETERMTGTNGLELTVNQVIQYEYDHLYRLTEADYSTGDLYEYVYDPVGNRLQQIINGDTTSYQYDAANRLEAVSHQAVTQTYTFDNNGNLLNTGVMTNSFDAANRLVSSSRNEVTVQPLYNGVGDRVGQTVETTTTHFALDVQGLPEVIYTSEGDLYLHLPGVIMTEKEEEVRYLLSDGLGSIRQVTDDNGVVIAYNEFDPYGNPVQDGSQPYGFTGEWWQDEIDLLHLRARWYMPYLNQFISPDPIIPDYFHPQSLNQYSYVLNNPINATDPTGMCAEFGDDACWNVYDQIIMLCPECAYLERASTTGDRKLHEETSQYLRGILEHVQAGWRPPLSEEYRRTQIMRYAERMARLAESGDITDLEALAQITEFAAKLYDENSRTEIQAFVDDIGLVIVGHAGPFAPITVEGPFQTPRSPYSVYDREGLRDFGATGFALELQDESNQLRHFWFAVVIEMCYPSELNKLQGILHETSLLSGTPAGRSLQDILLTFQGSGLGVELDNGTVRLVETGDWIRENLGPK